MYYVYILVSFVTGELYIGYTNNIKKRIVEHNTNRSFSTRKKGPWILVYNESYSNFEKTPGYQPGDELNLICRPPLEGNRGLLVRGGRHKIILFILYFLPLIIFLNNTFIAVLIIVAVSYFLMLSRSKKFALAEQN